MSRSSVPRPSPVVALVFLLFLSELPVATADAGAGWQGAGKTLFNKLAPVVGKAAITEVLTKLQDTTSLLRSVPMDKKVMLMMHVDGKRKRDKLWDPKAQTLADVLDATGLEVKEVDLAVQVRDGDSVFHIDLVTKEDVQDLLQHAGEDKFLKVEVHIVQPSAEDSVKAKAAVGVDTTSDWLHAAKEQIIGDVSSEDVVLQAVSEGSVQKVASLEDERHSISLWPTAVKALAARLNLTGVEAKELELAAHQENSARSMFHHSNEGSLLSTTFTSYRTVKDGDHIRIAYGHFEHQWTQVAASSGALTNTVEWSGRLFGVLPEGGSPDSTEWGWDVENKQFSLPSGAQLVDIADADFDSILEHVIGGHGWGTGILVVREEAARRWPGYWTLTDKWPGYAGTEWKDDCSSFLKVGGGSYTFTGGGMRLLVEVPPPPTVEDLSTQLLSFVEASARREWAKLLDSDAERAEL